MAMIDKFAKSEGGEYLNSFLTEAAKNHASTQRFINNIKASLAYEMKRNTNFVRNNGTLRYIRETGEPDQNRTDIPSPIWDDNMTGLRTAINDTWGYDIKIWGFTVNELSKTFEAKLEIEIFDHFGLNPPDIDPDIKPLFSKLSGFRSWFVLQHSTKFCKKPFITIVKFNQNVNGSY